MVVSAGCAIEIGQGAKVAPIARLGSNLRVARVPGIRSPRPPNTRDIWRRLASGVSLGPIARRTLLRCPYSRIAMVSLGLDSGTCSSLKRSSVVETAGTRSLGHSAQPPARDMAADENQRSRRARETAASARRCKSRCKRSGKPHCPSSSANVASRGEAAVAAGATPCLLRLVPSGREQTGARA